ncbi:MAG: transposase [Bryobacter sp.]|jgi:putative transposase|nr:transposase [Verrucomicrobiota bacterium]MBZ2186777.1 transposase [Bryobacter sp. CoA8 C33]
MKKKRYSNEEIARILEAGASTNKSVEEFCREHGVHPQTYYGWKKKFGGMSGDEVQRLRQLEQENGRLKRALADAMLDNQILKELNAKKW